MTVGSGPLAGSLGSSYTPAKRVEAAKLLVGPKLAAAVEFPHSAFGSNRFNAESNVSVVLATNTKDGARFSLSFGYCEQGLFYDPTIYFTHTEDMMLAGPDGVAQTFSGGANMTAASCKRGDTECLRARRRERPITKNGGDGLRASGLLQAIAGLACAVLAVLVL